MSPGRRGVLGLLAIGVLAGGFWFLLLAPTRAETAAVEAKLAQAASQRDAAIAAAQLAEEARAHYPRDYAALSRLAEAVPTDEDVAALVHGLDSVARANRVDVRAIKLSEAMAEEPAADAPASASGEEAAPDGGTAGDDGAAAAGDTPTDANGPAASAPTPAAPTDATDPAQAPAGGAVGPAALMTMPFTFTADGGYLPMQRFLKELHSGAKHARGRIKVNGRLVTIEGFSLAAGRNGFPQVKATITATAYLEPDPGGVIAGATVRGPAAGATPTPAASPSGAPAGPVAPR